MAKRKKKVAQKHENPAKQVSQRLGSAEPPEVVEQADIVLHEPVETPSVEDSVPDDRPGPDDGPVPQETQGAGEAALTQALQALAVLTQEVRDLKQGQTVGTPLPAPKPGEPIDKSPREFTRGLVTIPESRDPSRRTNQLAYEGAGPGGVFRPRDPRMPSSVVQAPMAAAAQRKQQQRKNTELMNQMSRDMTVTLYLTAGPRRVGPGIACDFDRMQELGYWDRLCGRKGQPAFSDPEIIVRSVQIHPEAREDE